MATRHREEAPPSRTLALLEEVRDGDRTAFGELFSHVYDELRALARNVRRGRADATVNTTALVHEVYVKLVPRRAVRWESRKHFFRLAAKAMRQVLVDAARKSLAQKRGGADLLTVTFDEEVGGRQSPVENVLALDGALERLAGLNERAASVVEQRFFAGRTLEETSRILDISTATVERDWRAARAWLAVEIGGASTEAAEADR